jgi:hypothetical protein
VDPYEEALCMCNLSDGGKDAFFPIDHYKNGHSIQYNKVCSHFSWIYFYSFVVLNSDRFFLLVTFCL